MQIPIFLLYQQGINLIQSKFQLNNRQAVTSEEAKEFADANNMKYIETSAKTGKNVKEMFMNMIKIVYNKVIENKIKTDHNVYLSIRQISGVRIQKDSNIIMKLSTGKNNKNDTCC